MTQRTGSEPIDKPLHDLLRDRSISSRALAFVYAIWLLADGKSEVRLERRAVEITTGMLHHRWPEAKAKALGTYLDDRGSNRYVDGHGEAGTWVVRQFGPITTPCVCPSTASLMHTTEVCGSGLYRSQTAVGGDGTVLSHPADMVWDSLGEYRYDGWRLHLLVGDRDVLVTAADLTWMKPRTAQRFLVKARAATFVVDGMWRGTLLTRLVEEMGGSPRVELIRNRARKEVFANTEKLRLLMDRHAQLDAYLERTQGEYLALALERGSEPAVLWAKEMGDPDLRKAFAYGRKQKPEVVEGWGVFTAKEHAPVTKSELLAALSQRFGNDRLVIVKDL